MFPQQTFSSGLNSPSIGSKQSPFNNLEASFNQGSNDSWADSSDENGLRDAFPKWMQVGLLAVMMMCYNI